MNPQTLALSCQKWTVPTKSISQLSLNFFMYSPDHPAPPQQGLEENFFSTIISHFIYQCCPQNLKIGTCSDLWVFTSQKRFIYSFTELFKVKQTEIKDNLWMTVFGISYFLILRVKTKQLPTLTWTQRKLRVVNFPYNSVSKTGKLNMYMSFLFVPFCHLLYFKGFPHPEPLKMNILKEKSFYYLPSRMALNKT